MGLFNNGKLVGGSGNWVADTKSRLTHGDAVTDAAINRDGDKVTTLTGDFGAGTHAAKTGKMPSMHLGQFFGGK